SAESPLPKERREKVVFHDNGWGVTHTEETLYEAVLGSFEGQETADACVRGHIEAGLIRGADGKTIEPAAYDQSRDFVFRHLLKAVLDAKRKAEPERPTQELLLNTYRTHRELWTAEERMWELTAPLMNFDSAIDPTQLTPEIWLRPLTAEEKSRRFRFND